MSTALAKQPSGRSLTPERITRKVKAALDAMVWQGLKRPEAAASAGLTDHALYCALRKPHVKAAYLAECEVLRVSGRARNIHRLNEIRDAANNMPAVNAIKALEQLGDDADGHSHGATRASPGVTIVIQGDAQVAAVLPKGSASD